LGMLLRRAGLSATAGLSCWLVYPCDGQTDRRTSDSTAH